MMMGWVEGDQVEYNGRVWSVTDVFVRGDGVRCVALGNEFWVPDWRVNGLESDVIDAEE
jgi:hypothetical protein